jgi:hypothetical protein
LSAGATREAPPSCKAKIAKPGSPRGDAGQGKKNIGASRNRASGSYCLVSARIAARMTLMFAIPIFAKIAVTAAKIADSKAQKSQDADQVFKVPRFRAPRANLPDGE